MLKQLLQKTLLFFLSPADHQTMYLRVLFEPVNEAQKTLVAFPAADASG